MRPMSRVDVQTNLRLPADLKDRLQASAEANNRSLSAEVAFRLEASFSSGPVKAGVDLWHRVSLLERQRSKLHMQLSSLQRLALNLEEQAQNAASEPAPPYLLKDLRSEKLLNLARRSALENDIAQVSKDLADLYEEASADGGRL